MQKTIQSIRGMNDILPDQSGIWQYIETAFVDVLSQYGYGQIKTPIVESTDLFARSIGDATDIVEKEMYTFADRNGDSLTLRPEGTASVVRAGLQHGLFYNQVQKLWYSGPMFRHERPQKGRYRQFYQLGAEAFGYAGPDVDAEQIVMLARFWDYLGLSPYLTLQINTLGTVEERKSYRNNLVEYCRANLDQLDADSKRRLDSNPLRILDSKNPQMADLIAKAPKLIDYLGDESLDHFENFKKILDGVGIKYQINPYLVRGLDYYTHTVFEWVTDSLGSQGTVCAGGRYNGLVKNLGGHDSQAVGFAMGLERLVLMLESLDLINDKIKSNPDIYVIVVGEKAVNNSLQIVEKMRNNLPHKKIIMHCGGGSFKSQFKKADKSGAQIAVILADNELEKGKVGVKYLREEKPQELMGVDELVVA